MYRIVAAMHGQAVGLYSEIESHFPPKELFAVQLSIETFKPP